MCTGQHLARTTAYRGHHPARHRAPSGTTGRAARQSGTLAPAQDGVTRTRAGSCCTLPPGVAGPCASQRQVARSSACRRQRLRRSFAHRSHRLGRSGACPPPYALREEHPIPVHGVGSYACKRLVPVPASCAGCRRPGPSRRPGSSSARRAVAIVRVSDLFAPVHTVVASRRHLAAPWPPSRNASTAARASAHNRRLSTAVS